MTVRSSHCQGRKRAQGPDNCLPMLESVLHRPPPSKLEALSKELQREICHLSVLDNPEVKIGCVIFRIDRPSTVLDPLNTGYGKSQVVLVEEFCAETKNVAPQDHNLRMCKAITQTS